MLQNTVLAQALEHEDILVKQGDHLYVPGAYDPEAIPAITLEGLRFRLAPAASIDSLEERVLSPDVIYTLMLGSSKVASSGFGAYADMNRLLEFGIAVISRLKQDIAYQHLLQGVAERFSFPDEQQLEQEFAHHAPHLAAITQPSIPAAPGVLKKMLPEHMIVINGTLYNLILKGNDKKSSIIVTTNEPNELVPSDLSSSSTYFLKSCTANLKMSLSQSFSAPQLENYFTSLRYRRFCLLQKMKSENFAAYGLLLENKNETSLTIKMVLPEILYPIFGRALFYRVRQSELYCTIKPESLDHLFDIDILSTAQGHPYVDSSHKIHACQGRFSYAGVPDTAAGKLAARFINYRWFIMYSRNLEEPWYQPNPGHYSYPKHFVTPFYRLLHRKKALVLGGVG